MSINSFNNIFLDNGALLDNSNFPLITFLSTLGQILDKRNDRVSHHLNKMIPFWRKSKILYQKSIRKEL